MKVVEDFWQSTEREPEPMWASWQDRQRTQILTTLSCIPPFKSIYELGCGAGPNLRRILHARPGVIVGGSEPNENLAAWASEHLGAPIDRNELPHAPGPSWDVALSCYTMSYVDETTARQTLENVRSRNFIILEPTAGIAPFGAPGAYTGEGELPCYVHDYLGLAELTGWRVLWRWPLYPHHQGLNVVLTLERT